MKLGIHGQPVLEAVMDAAFRIVSESALPRLAVDVTQETFRTVKANATRPEIAEPAVNVEMEVVETTEMILVLQAQDKVVGVSGVAGARPVILMA